MINAFISRRTRPRLIISDNARVFKTTADWVKTVRKSEKLQNYLARENIRWQINFAKSPWCGRIYETLIKEIKKTLHKTLEKLHRSYEAFELVVMDVEKNLNSQPLTYIEAERGEKEVLTPNTILWGRDVHPVDDTEASVTEKLINKDDQATRRW